VDLPIEGDAKVAFQIGSLIGRCAMNMDSTGIVDRYIIPRLRRIFAKEKMPADLKARILSLVSVAEGLKALPLSLCHIDINRMNVIVDANANVAGLVDWEMAQLLPV
jgi:thiamine kinase-like enzyme